MLNLESFVGILVVFFFTIINFIIIRYHQNYYFMNEMMKKYDKREEKRKKLYDHEPNIYIIIAACVSIVEILFTLFLIVWPEFLFLILSGDINVANNQLTFEKATSLSLIRLWGSFVLIINGLYLIVNINSLSYNLQRNQRRKEDESYTSSSQSILHFNNKNKSKKASTIKKTTDKNYNNIDLFHKSLLTDIDDDDDNDEVKNKTYVVQHNPRLSYMFLSLLIIKKTYYILGLVFGIMLTFLEISSTSSNSVTVLLLNPAYITTMIFGIIIHLTLTIFYRYLTLNYTKTMMKMIPRSLEGEHIVYESDNLDDDYNENGKEISEEIIKFLIYI